MGEKSDLGKKRMLLLLLLFAVLLAFVYVYVVEIVTVVVVLFVSWLAYDYIHDYTRESVEPAGRYVFITGCDTGFGLASAKAIRDLGFGVIAGCYDDNSAGAKELRARPWVQKVEVVSLDVTNEASVAACAKEVREICQDQGLWAVINNAGMNSMGPVELVSMEAYRRVAEVNLWGVVRVTKAVLPLVRHTQGRVINVTSERGYNPWPGSSSYCTTKFGLIAFSACLRAEMERFKVKVITVAPGQFAGATGIANTKLNETLMDGLLGARSTLSLADQHSAYPVEEVEKISRAIAEAIPRSCQSPQPVVEAYLRAVSDACPRRCYMVHGTQRKCLDPLIILSHVRAFVPERAMYYVERVVLSVL